MSKEKKRGEKKVKLIPVIAGLLVICAVLSAGCVSSSDDSEWKTLSSGLSVKAAAGAAAMAEKLAQAKSACEGVCADAALMENSVDAHAFAKEEHDKYGLDANTLVILVDSTGTGHCSNGEHIYYSESGRLINGALKEQVFVSYSSPADSLEMTDYVCVLKKLASSKDAKAGGEDAVITHVSIYVPAEEFVHLYTDAINSESNGFILDEDGEMQYRYLPLGLLINGNNFFTKMYQVKHLHNVDAVSEIGQVKHGVTVVCEIIIDGKNYIYTLSPLAGSEWVGASITPAELVRG
ncbi:MAG TPA: hypothetical protein O0X70_06690 [Methanocorpusculum sp.]|nr:hypothetical protein [Methanocorpusculum sp.]